MNPCTPEFLDHVGWRPADFQHTLTATLLLPLNNERTLHLDEVLNLLHLAGASARKAPLWVATDPGAADYGIRVDLR